MQHLLDAILDRRRLLGGAGVLGLSLAAAAAQGTPIPSGVLADELVINLSGPPDHLDPALTYSVRDWAILHSVYDALIDFAADGTLVPLAAETFESDDATTFRVVLREGRMFHDGTPVKAEAIARAVEHLQAAESQISDLFGTITDVRVIDDLRADIVASEPAPWLPSQIAVWLVLFPKSSTPASLETTPVGAGPYVFESHDPGTSITLVRNPDYPVDGPKGQPLAERVTYRFVPESATRIADLTTGTAHIVSDIPIDQLAAVEEAGAEAVVAPILGTAFIRIATDVEPFIDPRVRQALNLGVDVQAIADAIVGDNTRRLASFFPDSRGLGFDESVEPFPYDPDRARQLLADAGLPDGFDTEVEVVSTSRIDVLEAVAAQLAEIGIRLSIVTSDLASFNQGWSDPEAPPLRYASWRPFYDPHTFLRLVVDSSGFLSRYQSDAVDAVIREAAIEPDTGRRAELLRSLNDLLQEEPAAIYLWNITARYGVAREFAHWTPRGDEYVLPMTQGDNR